jgi:hypothetical protein
MSYVSKLVSRGLDPAQETFQLEPDPNQNSSLAQRKRDDVVQSSPLANEAKDIAVSLIRDAVCRLRSTGWDFNADVLGDIADELEVTSVGEA